ncbi:WD40 repeat-like protein [Lichtheimia hyalospora FSU 10163]|nr:WD40 repeat-like protein [Lichtheimia hyalospora FSU 10163]
MSDDNEMIIVDDDSPPPLDNLALDELPPPLPSSLSPSTPVPLQSSRSKITELVSKMTRKHRKNKRQPGDGMSEFDEDESDEDDQSDTSSSTSSSDDNMAEDVDGVDTDDLLEEADELPPLRNKKVIVSTRRVVAMLNKTREKKLRALKQAKARAKKRDHELLTALLLRPPPRRTRIQDYQYDPAAVEELANQYPDSYWQFHADREFPMVDVINEKYPVKALNQNLGDHGPVTAMTLSPDGVILATFSSTGAIQLWDIADNFKLLRRLRDSGETQIEEFYCGKFSNDQELIVAGGKLKNRSIFSVETGHRVGQLDGHAEEVLCIKAVSFKGENYYLSTSQDGYIIKWHMNQDWITLVDSIPMDDGLTCMAFTVSFVPNTGNKLFMAACDAHLRLYDFEEALLLQTFEDIYSSYCDCGKFVRWLDEADMEQQSDTTEQVNDEKKADNDKVEPVDQQIDTDPQKDKEKGNSANNEPSLEDKKEIPQQQHAWFISRGAEMCDVSEGLSSIPNVCTLHKLIFPSEKGGRFQLEQIKRYGHEDYHANSWLVKITTNGRYLLAPTIYGQLFVFNMLTGQVTAVIKEHEDLEVRDVIFHPYRPLVFSSGDDGYVKVYTFEEAITT